MATVFFVDRQQAGGKFINYTLRDELGREKIISTDVLSKLIASGKMKVMNLTLRSDGKLQPTSPKHEFSLPRDKVILNMLRPGDAEIISINKSNVKQISYDKGVILGLTIELRYTPRINLIFRWDRVDFVRNNAVRGGIVCDKNCCVENLLSLCGGRNGALPWDSFAHLIRNSITPEKRGKVLIRPFEMPAEEELVNATFIGAELKSVAFDSVIWRGDTSGTVRNLRIHCILQNGESGTLFWWEIPFTRYKDDGDWCVDFDETSKLMDFVTSHSEVRPAWEQAWGKLMAELTWD